MIKLLALCALLLPAAPALGAPRPNLITFGINTPEWNLKLSPSGVRMGCALTAAECMIRVEKNAKLQNVAEVYLAIPLEADKSAERARQYSALSLEHPVLREIGIDDFTASYAQLFKTQLDDPRAELAAIVDGVKSRNPRLAFGVTIYENDLKSVYLKERNLPASIRNKVDLVHLYIHYRENGPRFAAHVRAARRVFPRAAVIAGSYPYDRVDKLPCAEGGSKSCTRERELALFEESFKIQAALLAEGKVIAIEFYPAEFGLEDKWKGWDKPRTCEPRRRTECLENTAIMRRAILAVLSEKRP